MKIAVFAYSRRGCETARRAAALFPEDKVTLWAPPRLDQQDFSPLTKPTAPLYGELFLLSDAMIFVGACGIAVRAIAPHLVSKTTDPAVLCLDEAATFVISLLSGHMGGANALCRTVAGGLGAQSVITTATDVRGRFSVDAWAREQGYLLDDMGLAKAVSAAILEGPVPFASDLSVAEPLPEGLVSADSGPLGIYLGWRTRGPFDRTLRVIPRVLRLGLGCRRGISKAAVAGAVDAVLEEHGVDPRAVACAASIDLKSGEAGLLEFCAERNLPAEFYDAGTLSRVEGDFTPSDFVRQVTGVDNVCERAALLGASKLLIKKTARDGVTVALAVKLSEVRFGETVRSGHRPGQL